MSLFTIKRFGDEDASVGESQAAAILRKLNQSAERKRKKSLAATTDHDEEKSIAVGTSSVDVSLNGKTLKKNNKRKTLDNTEVPADDLINSRTLEVSDSAETGKKKRRKSTVNESISAATEDTCQRLTGNDEALVVSCKTRQKQLPEKLVVKISDKRRENVVDDHEAPKTSLEREEEVSDAKEIEDIENDLGVSADEPEHAKNDGEQDVGGFTVMGQVQEKRLDKLSYKLPDWLAHPTVILSDVRDGGVPLDDVTDIHEELVLALRDSGITKLFPVQQHLVPAILRGCQPSYYSGLVGYRPRDICCSSPTGSGKTLAFALPIVQALKSRVVPRVRALIVLPVRDLAKQVHKVFQALCKKTTLKVGLVVGQKAFGAEQATLVKTDKSGVVHSLVDIVVASPGRLVDHVQKTPGFDLGHLRFIVIDEADRILDEIKQDWLHHVTTAVNRRHGYNVFSQPITIATVAKNVIPPQKLLFSATLTQNPDKLQQLDLFQPQLFTSIVVEQKRKPAEKTPDEQREAASPLSRPDGAFLGKYTTPTGLTEYFMECTPQQRPLLVLHALHNLKFKRVLCFTNSNESTHRLACLVRSFGRGVEIGEFSSNMDAGKRDKIVKKFEAGKVHMIVCSDSMARGMDVANVKYVISYEPPLKIKTYIHRVGRTARAGRAGVALSLLERKEVYNFKRMLKASGKTNVEEQKVRPAVFKGLLKSYKAALHDLANILKTEILKKSRKKR